MAVRAVMVALVVLEVRVEMVLPAVREGSVRQECCDCRRVRSCVARARLSPAMETAIRRLTVLAQSCI